MVHYSKVIRGIAAYVDNELVGKMAGSLKGWAFGALAGLVAAEADSIFNQYKNAPMLTALRLVEGENINVDKIYGELQKQAQRGNATAVVPILGPVTFSTADVDSLMRYIKGA